MKPTQHTKVYLQKLIYMLIIIFPSVFTGNMYNLVNQDDTTDALLVNLAALSNTIYTGIKDSQNHIVYSLELLLSHEAFADFNLYDMGQQINAFTYYNKTLANAYLMNQDGEVLFGVNDSLSSNTPYTSHINSALEGTSAFYTTFMHNEPFTQFAVPIYTNTSYDLPEACLVMTYSLDPLEGELASLTNSSPHMRAYLIDRSGNVITASSTDASLWHNRQLDIGAIKRSIDYDPTLPFSLFDASTWIGIYYTLPDTEWTLLVTAPPPESIATSDIFSWLSGLLGAASISTLELLHKRNQKLASIDCIEAIL